MMNPTASLVVSPATLKSGASIPSVRVLGVPLHILNMQELLSVMEEWIARRDKSRWIAMTSSHGIIESFKRADFKAILKSADLAIPDGKWTAQVAGRMASTVPKRVRAEDLIWNFSSLASRRGYSGYFFGDTDEVQKLLIAKLRSHFPSIKIAGRYSPPFRPLTPEEDSQILERINAAKPDVLWVSLGLPKQEEWIFAHRDKLSVPVIAAVGAGFKFVSGKVKPAPRRVSELGLEWLWRLLTEPRRVWHRALVYGPQFALHTFLEIKGFRKYD
jgi:N-acetylglucosaminyldiphosphoundecaprenol N-acetyl-beta-D-mannosaminyltransferase